MGFLAWLAAGRNGRFLLLACSLVLMSRSVAATPDWQAVAPGVDFHAETRPDGPWAIHVVRIDRKLLASRLVTGLGQGTVVGLETLPTMAARRSKELGAAPVAAVNGDFYVLQLGLYQGDPIGLQLRDGELVSAPRDERGTFWLDAQGTPRIGSVKSALVLELPGGRKVPLGLNEACPEDGAVLFTPTFGPNTRTTAGADFSLTPSPSDGTGAGAEKGYLPLRVGRDLEMWARPLDTTNAAIPRDGFVVGIGPELLSSLGAPPEGSARLRVATKPDLAGVRTAIGGGRILVRQGAATSRAKGDVRHPRSMVGFDAEHLFLFAIDGRQPEHSIGMSYPEMAELAVDFGCDEAMELDGGGSTTLWAGGSVRNKPSGFLLRPLANGLILLDADKR